MSLINLDEFKIVQFNVIGFGSKLNGSIAFTGSTVICGEIEGEISVTAGDLIIEKTASIQGQIFGGNIQIAGKFTGEIKSTATVALLPGAEVFGKIQSLNLSVYPGAQAEVEASTIKEAQLL